MYDYRFPPKKASERKLSWYYRKNIGKLLLIWYICHIFHSHCFLINISHYIVILTLYVLYKMKRKAETKIQSKRWRFVVLWIIILLSYSYLADFLNEILKYKIVAVTEKFTIFKFCCFLFQIRGNRKAWLPPVSFLQYNWFIRNMQREASLVVCTFFASKEMVCTLHLWTRNTFL